MQVVFVFKSSILWGLLAMIGGIITVLYPGTFNRSQSDILYPFVIVSAVSGSLLVFSSVLLLLCF